MKLFVGCLAVLAVSGYAAAEMLTSSGVGGDKCGSQVCLANKATCVNTTCDINKPNCMNKTCECNEPRWGKGVLSCYRNNELKVEVTNDPHINDYNDEHFDMPFACRYLLTHVVTELKNKDRAVIGSCEMMVHVFHHKKDGKFYVGGIQNSYRIELNNGSRYEMNFQINGTAEGNNYYYDVKSTAGIFGENGPYEDDHVMLEDKQLGLLVTATIDKDNNLAQIDVKKCGTSVKYRAYDPVAKRSQLLVPGMVASVTCAAKPTFESVDKVLATPSTQVHNGFKSSSIEIDGLGLTGTMLYRAYMSGIEQIGPQKNEQCTKAKEAIEQCADVDEVKLAIKSCQWIMTSTKMIRCFDKSTSGEHIQKLFNTCVGVFCGSPKKACTEVTQPLIDHKRKCIKFKHEYSLMKAYVSWCDKQG